MIKKKRALRLFILFLESVEIIDNVLDGNESADIGVVNGDSESFFAEHYEVCKLNRIDSEVCRELGLHGNVVGIDLELVNEESLQLFKHYSCFLRLKFTQA